MQTKKSHIFAAVIQRGKDMIKQMNLYGKNAVPFLFVVDFDCKAPFLVPASGLQEQGVFAQIGTLSHYPAFEKLPDTIRFEKQPAGFNEYQKAFDIVRKYIYRGDSFLLNLTFPAKIKTNLSLKQIFIHSTAKYKLLVQDKFTVFSPEPFIRINDGIISSYPMKGTIDASLPDAEKKLSESIKEISEHNTIVDLIRNDIAMVAKKVRVTKFRYMEKIKTLDKELLQTSSEISGILPYDWRKYIGDILFKLLPAGSISGAPKKKTVEIIREAENYERGYFTGVFGYFDGERLDSAVMIRFIEKNDDGMFFKSGGGITYFSKPEDEYTELIDKIYVPIIGNRES